LIAFGKLQGIIPGQPLVYRGQNIFNMSLLAVTIGLFIYLIFVPTAVIPFYIMLGLAFAFGVLLVMPIGSADMPVVMSLLNSYAGLASAATGFVLGNNVLIIAGTLDGFSGFILSILMCRAMNRSLTNVLFGAFGSAATGVAASGEQVSCAKSASRTSPCKWLMRARSSLSPVTVWRQPRRNTPCVNWRTSWKAAGSP
jgi:NAD(P) transhydrogenase subunit beta